MDETLIMLAVLTDFCRDYLIDDRHFLMDVPSNSLDVKNILGEITLTIV